MLGRRPLVMGGSNRCHGRQPVFLADFRQIQSIKCVASDIGKATLQLIIEAAPQPLSIKTSSLAMAENMADLIDGYCRLENETETSIIWTPKKG
uniref:FAK1-like FERM domain-containing protein n=1 Tax=Callorhinchus milii TaxID=7868 RepID=A0A4W3GLK0_CALMI